jgi:hypothetical protein
MDWTALLNQANKRRRRGYRGREGGAAHRLRDGAGRSPGRGVRRHGGPRPCPFHADSDPSFDIFGESLERWGCFPCGLGGDVLDLIGRLFKAEDFKTQMDMARQLIEEKNAAGWTGPTTGVKKEFDWEAARALVEHDGRPRGPGRRGPGLP